MSKEYVQWIKTLMDIYNLPLSAGLMILEFIALYNTEEFKVSKVDKTNIASKCMLSTDGYKKNIVKLIRVGILTRTKQAHYKLNIPLNKTSDNITISITFVNNKKHISYELK